ncbi:MAG: tRNA (cytidine(34)-2'-O)-methyltransferase [Clostridiales bacterium]|jgi:tRNA (cytidine/uridine-2'-O-)-methyltransferase|nr:tRNA (cytidine(34)-2'-O)-methyltransferase [Clostridiales bacterium]
MRYDTNIINIVLYEPEIPQNTGNIVRTAVATGGAVHLIKPLGFEISDKRLKRAGLDYWKDAKIFLYEDFADFKSKNHGRCFFASTKAAKRYDAVRYENGDCIIFGPESRGLDEKLLRENYAAAVRIPMVKNNRSLNLSNSVAVIVYEALRQWNFLGLETESGFFKKDF